MCCGTQGSGASTRPARLSSGESCGALTSALTAIRARAADLDLTAKVLVNPVVDVTGTMFDYAAIAAVRG